LRASQSASGRWAQRNRIAPAIVLRAQRQQGSEAMYFGIGGLILLIIILIILFR
jgi:hypothetical protein